MSLTYLSSHNDFDGTWAAQVGAEIEEPQTAVRHVTAIEPGESSREELLLRKLGDKGWGRFHYFKRYFSSPWGENRNKPLSPRAQELFFRFLTFPKVQFVNQEPSLFITDAGHLELVWEDSQGKRLEVEFGPDFVEYYRERDDLEGGVSGDNLESLVPLLSC